MRESNSSAIRLSFFFFEFLRYNQRAVRICVVFLIAMIVTDRLCSAQERPNILWIVVDDMSAHFSCYGEKLIQTPAVDRLAAEGTRFTRAYVTAPVCSACRSALITGMYQTTIGAHHHRSGRGELKIRLPEDVIQRWRATGPGWQTRMAEKLVRAAPK